MRPRPSYPQTCARHAPGDISCPIDCTDRLLPGYPATPPGELEYPPHQAEPEPDDESTPGVGADSVEDMDAAVAAAEAIDRG